MGFAECFVDSRKLLETGIWCGDRRTVVGREGPVFAGLEFGGFFDVPHRVSIKKSAIYGPPWNRIGNCPAWGKCSKWTQMAHGDLWPLSALNTLQKRVTRHADLWTPFRKSNRVNDGPIVANRERKESYYHENARKR